MWVGILVGLLLIAIGGLSISVHRLVQLRRRFGAVVNVADEVTAQQLQLAELRRQQTDEAVRHVARLQAAEAEHTVLADRRRAALEAEFEAHRARLESERTAHRQAAENATAAHVAALAEREQQATARHTAEAARLSAEIRRLANEKDEQERLARARMLELEKEYSEAHAAYTRLKTALAAVVDENDDISFGLYRPQFKYDTPERFKVELERVWQEQKTMIRMDDATVCPHEWSIGGSRAEGRKMQKQLSKLMLRAFNGEAEAAIAKVAWNNAPKMEERIRRAAEAIDGLGTVIGIRLSSAYVALAIRELQLSHEMERKKQQIQEEQREIREQMREEERAQREATRAQEEAEREEARYEKALARAKAELERAKGAEIGTLNEKIAELEKSLSDAHAQKERAKSMAELTKAGYVYIVSNIGSFGEGVVKIGMTRRLEPMDRIRELGDASVPFSFDVHAMVYSEDAPRLEQEFHKRFEGSRLNLVNPRKEFFSVQVSALAGFAEERGLRMQLTQMAEAREYRESVAIRASAQKSSVPASPNSQRASFPEHLPTHASEDALQVAR